MANQEEVKYLVDGLIEDGPWDSQEKEMDYLTDWLIQDDAWEEDMDQEERKALYIKEKKWENISEEWG